MLADRADLSVAVASSAPSEVSELHRFADPAEAAATLAVRDGRPEAIGFYLDRQRVHIGDPTTTLDAAFNAWQADRSHGRDAIVLAPTRELVRILNQRARDHRLAGTTPGREVALADGNRAQCRRPDHHPQERAQTPHHRN